MLNVLHGQANHGPGMLSQAVWGYCHSTAGENTEAGGGGGLSLGFIVEKRQVIYISSSSFEESASFLSRFSGDTADAWEMLGYADGTVHLGCLPYIQK